MDDNKQQKIRKSKWITHSNMTIFDSEQGLNLISTNFVSQAIPAHSILAEAKVGVEDPGMDDIQKIKDYLRIHGYPTEAGLDFKEAKINDLAFFIISPILSNFIRKTGHRRIYLLRKQSIAFPGSQTGDYAEFVVMEMVSVAERNFIPSLKHKRLLSKRR